MIIYKLIVAFSLFFMIAGARAQHGSLSPDPFDAIDAGLEQEPGTQAAEGGETAAQEEYSDFPTYLSLVDNLTEFGRFADGGSDSNWYIGFDNAWIVKLPPAPNDDYQRAFIGAKIGRAKTTPKAKRPWERDVIPGKIYMAISQKASFTAEQSFFLAETKDLPLQADDTLYMPGVGQSEWFWAEVPLNTISSTLPNYLIIWSPTREFRGAEQSPILAAAEAGSAAGADDNQAWNHHSLQGVPPRHEAGTLRVPINLKPALAIKLTPPPGGGVAVTDFSMRPSADKMLFRVSAEGKNVELAWIEMSQDKLEWRRISPYLRRPPYLFTLGRNVVPPRGAYFRGKARDILAVEGNGKDIFVPSETPQ